MSAQQNGAGNGSNGKCVDSQSGIYVTHNGKTRSITAIIDTAEFNGRIEVMRLLRELRDARVDLRLVKESVRRMIAQRRNAPLEKGV